MKKSHYILLLLLVIIAPYTYAQHVPGYQGKRTYIEFNFFSAPALRNVDIKGNQYGLPSNPHQGLFAWNVRNKLNINYVTKRNAEIGGSFNFGATGVLDENNELGSIRFSSIGFNRNWYLVKTTGALAPLGRYIRFETQYIQSSVLLVNIPRLDYHFGYVSGGIGTRRVFKDFITFNLSMQTGFVFPLGGNSTDTHEYYKGLVTSRIRSHYIYEMNVGLGLLLF